MSSKKITKKTFIFFPIEAGLAHITRSLSIAEELVKRKHRVIFALSKRKQFLIKNKAIEVINIGEFFADEQLIEKVKDPDYIQSFVKEELEILKKYQPDVAVIDFRLSAIISCKLLQIPVAFITNTDGLFFKFYIPNIGLPRFLQKIVTPIFQLLISNFKDQYANTLVKVGKGMDSKLTKKQLLDLTYIIPEPKDYLPAQDGRYKMNYVGPIWWKGFEEFKPAWLTQIKPDGRTIYLTFGGTGYDPAKLILLSNLLIKKGYRVIVSSSNIADPKQFKPSDNLFVEKFLPGFAVCKRVDLVICHGGIGSLAQALISKKPVVAVPFNPDQYLHGFRFQELGLGRCISSLSLFNLTQIDWQNFQRKGRELPVEKILKTVEEVLDNKSSFTNAINKYSEKFAGEGTGPAADILENLLK